MGVKKKPIISSSSCIIPHKQILSSTKYIYRYFLRNLIVIYTSMTGMIREKSTYSSSRLRCQRKNIRFFFTLKYILDAFFSFLKVNFNSSIYNQYVLTSCIMSSSYFSCLLTVDYFLVDRNYKSTNSPNVHGLAQILQVVCSYHDNLNIL